MPGIQKVASPGKAPETKAETGEVSKILQTGASHTWTKKSKERSPAKALSITKK
ncbi:MAG TPA: hypothetical protein VKA49_16685 [Flavitalea sp.]|nr:hypothetical protein [Flavitalea sp.]